MIKGSRARESESVVLLGFRVIALHTWRRASNGSFKSRPF
jgi:hypothetical protein